MAWTNPIKGQKWATRRYPESHNELYSETTITFDVIVKNPCKEITDEIVRDIKDILKVDDVKYLGNNKLQITNTAYYSIKKRLDFLASRMAQTINMHLLADMEPTVKKLKIFNKEGKF